MNRFRIINGRVYHPDQHSWSLEDVFVEGGALSAPFRDDAYMTIDADGCLVMPGLIDYHVHYFNHGTENGCNPDVASFPCGVTTAVDAGSTGCANYEMFRSSVMALSDVRILNMLFVGSGGQITDSYPEHLEAAYLNRERIQALFRRYPENLVGLKTKLSEGILSEAEAETSIRETVSLAEEIGTRVVAHITRPAMDLEKLCEILRPGDVICHCYQGKGRETILNSAGKVRHGILRGREKGILFDASNGCNNFDLEVAQQALRQGFWPDILSSDINTSGYYLQPLHSLPRILSKYLDFGMPLEDVLDAAILKPAALIGKPELASMDPGTASDVAIFKLAEKKLYYSDRDGHQFTGSQVLVPQLTMKDGKIMYCQADFT